MIDTQVTFCDVEVMGTQRLQHCFHKVVALLLGPLLVGHTGALPINPSIFHSGKLIRDGTRNNEPNRRVKVLDTIGQTQTFPRNSHPRRSSRLHFSTSTTSDELCLAVPSQPADHHRARPGSEPHTCRLASFPVPGDAREV